MEMNKSVKKTFWINYSKLSSKNRFSRAFGLWNIIWAEGNNSSKMRIVFVSSATLSFPVHEYHTCDTLIWEILCFIVHAPPSRDTLTDCETNSGLWLLCCTLKFLLLGMRRITFINMGDSLDFVSVSVLCVRIQKQIAIKVCWHYPTPTICESTT